MAAAVEILDRESIASAANAIEITWPDRRLAMAAGNVEHIGRLAQAGGAAVERAHERLPSRDRGAQMGGAGREIAMVEVVGLDPAFDQGAHQTRERRRIVVDPA